MPPVETLPSFYNGILLHTLNPYNTNYTTMIIVQNGILSKFNIAVKYSSSMNL